MSSLTDTILANQERYFRKVLSPHKVEMIQLSENEDDTTDNIYDGETHNQIVDLRSIDIITDYGDNYKENVLNKSTLQVLNGNMIEEWLQENASIPIDNKDVAKVLGTKKIDLLDGTVGGVVAGALNKYNEVADIFNTFGLKLPKAGYDPFTGGLNEALTPLESYKDEYLKTIRLGYQNSKLYNRLENIANSAADTSNLLATASRFVQGAVANDKNPFNLKGYETYPTEFQPTISEILELNTASFATMSAAWNKPEINIKTRKSESVQSNVYKNVDGSSSSQKTKFDDLLAEKNRSNLGVGVKRSFD